MDVAPPVNSLHRAVLPLSFYRRADVTAIAQDLLGKCLFTRIGNSLTGGFITETESYGGVDDKACHAYNGRRTKRTEVMFAPGGVAYVYLCYGVHSLFNVVTYQRNHPHAVLIRALSPAIGLQTMLQRRSKKNLCPTLTIGPGTVTQALGITTAHTGFSLLGPVLWIEDHNIPVPQSAIIASPRVGVGYAEEDALLPWRFRLDPSYATRVWK